MAFICDAMLGGLARWLRAGGYDAEFEYGIDDRALIERAAGSGRMILSSDGPLFERNILRSGKPVWSDDTGVFGTWLAYSHEYDVLLQSGRASRNLSGSLGISSVSAMLSYIPGMNSKKNITLHIPQTSQNHEEISISALAQRRALSEPTPMEMNQTARRA